MTDPIGAARAAQHHAVRAASIQAANAGPGPEGAAGGYEPSKAMTLTPSQRQEMADLSARAQAGDAAAAGRLERLETLHHAREMSHLVSDVYHHDDEAKIQAGDMPREDKRVVPAGWSRMSATPEALTQHGLSLHDLNPGDESGYRAELYVPDPDVFGPNAEPVLVFKGTNPASTEDWANNLGQGLSQPTDYYARAMKAADKLDQRLDGGFEIAGHSLGGGMASAAAAVTGEDATTFNAAGLHDATAARFLEGRGRLPTDPRQTTTAYIVEGEFLDSAQRGAAALDPRSADEAVSTIQGGVAAADRLGTKIDEVSDSWVGRRVLGGDTRAQIDDAMRTLAQVKTSVDGATGADLRALPTAAGNVVRLQALNADGTARAVAVPDVAAPGGFVDQTERVIGEAAAMRQESIDDFAAADRRAGRADEWLLGGEGLEDYGSLVGNVRAGEHVWSEIGGLSGAEAGAGAAGEAVARHAPGIARNGLDALIRQGHGN